MEKIILQHKTFVPSLVLLVQESEQEQRAWLRTHWLCWRSLEAAVRRPLPERGTASLSASWLQAGWGQNCAKHTNVLQWGKTKDLVVIRLSRCLLLGLSSQAGRSWQWSDFPLLPVCQHSRLASRPGWGSGPPPRCCEGVRLTCAASLLFRRDPEKQQQQKKRNSFIFLCP